MRLHEQGGVFASFVESTLRNGVHIASELGERLQFAILSLVGFQSTCNLFHRLYLSVTAHTRYRYTHVDGRADTCIEKTCLEEYLSVGNGDNVSGDICRYVARLCLVAKVLVENFGIAGIDTVEDDLKLFFGDDVEVEELAS